MTPRSPVAIFPAANGYIVTPPDDEDNEEAMLFLDLNSALGWLTRHFAQPRNRFDPPVPPGDTLVGPVQIYEDRYPA